MFDRIRIFRFIRGLHTKRCRNLKEEPNHGTRHPTSSENKDEDQYSRNQDIHNVPNNTESVNESIEGNHNHQIENIQERAVIQEGSSAHCSDVSYLENEALRIFIMHADSDIQHAIDLAKILRNMGCKVFLPSDIDQDDLTEKFFKTLTAVHNLADFIVPIVTETLISQLFHNRRNPYKGDELDRQVNCVMYNLACNEFSRAYCANYRVRPVCLTYEVADKVSNDPILQWCFRLYGEVPKLIVNLKNTKKYLLDPQTQSFRRPKSSTKVDAPNSLPFQTSREQKKTSSTNLAADKVALLIANQSYTSVQPLTAPAKDVDEIAEMLRSMDFKVIVVKDLRKIEMENVIRAFCSLLIPNSYALFFYAGHGLEKWGQTYLLPVDYTDKFSPKECICKQYILKCVQDKETALNVLFLDCCRKLPSREWKFLEPIVVNMDKNTVYVYATTFSNSASERIGGNSFFVVHLKKHLCKDKSIQKVIFQVQEDSHGERRLNPVIESSLTKPYKLCDKINYTAGRIHSIPWKINQEETFVDFPNFKCTILLRIKDYKMTYLDGISIYVWLITKEDTDLYNLQDKEINIEVPSVPLRLEPAKGLHLRMIDLYPNEEHILFKKQVFGLRIMENQFLKGNILFKRNNVVIEQSEFCIWLRRLKIQSLMTRSMTSLTTFSIPLTRTSFTL